MAARKLQAEIDRTLKRVSEGVELFDSIYDKMQASTNQTQKEKLELDLKSQIKKLQRLRDQIKAWVSSSEIKDKSALLDNRKIIETQMEKFKACEKEMKTKAFSKDGLIAALKLDPKEKEKAETSSWLTSQVDELSRQIEQSEAEVELLQAAGPKKRGKGGNQASRLEELAALNDRRKWHIGRLEIVLRLLENNSLEADKVLDLKQNISYFVESNTEEDFEEDDTMYDDLDLDEQDAAFGRVGGDDDGDESGSDTDGDSKPLPQRSPLKETRKSRSEEKKDEAHSPVLRKAVPVRKATLDSSKVPPPILPPAPNFAAQPMSQALKSGLPLTGAPGTAGSKPALPPIRYAAAVANSSAVTNGASSAAASPVVGTPSGPSTNGSSVSQLVNGSSSTATAILPPTPSTATPETSQASAASATTAPTPALSSAASVAAQENASTPPSPSITSSPIASSIAPASSIQPPDSSAYFDSRQQSPVLSNQVDQSVSGASPNVSTSVASGSSSNRAPTSVTSASQASPAVPSSGNGPISAVPPPSASSPLPQQVHNSQQSQQVANLPTAPQQQQQQQFANSLEIPTTSNGSSPLGSSTQQHPTYPPGVLPALPSQLQQQQQQSAQNQPVQSLQSSQQIPLQPQQQPPVSRSAGLPSSLADLVASFESAKQKAPTRMGNLNQVQKVLESGLSGLPQPRDTEKPKYYIPKNPYATPAYYPQSPLASFESPALYTRFDPETLFYIFYFHAGTYQQYLAARELKRQSWRFHTKYLTWFQRHSEPQAITDEYEQGVYVYFDWEGSWCQRKKSDFRFEYRYLSED